MNSRRVAKEYEAVTKGLNRNAPSVPPQNTPDEVKQVFKKNVATILRKISKLNKICMRSCITYNFTLFARKKTMDQHLNFTFKSDVFNFYW